MKTTIEVHGYEIKIDEMNDKILVSAVKDGETVEEFELDVEAGFEDEDKDDMESFGGEEEEDFEDEDMDDSEGDFEDEDMGDSDDMEEDEMVDEGKKLESFAHFVRRKK
jgi:hypothetical protein